MERSRTNDESYGTQGSTRELPRGDNTVRGDHKGNERDYNQDEISPHSGREKE